MKTWRLQVTTSSILTRLQDEIAEHIQHNGDMGITEVLMSFSTFHDFLKTMYESMRFYTVREINGGDYISFYSPWGPVRVMPSKHCEDHGVDMLFKTADGEIVSPIDEAINRILLEY